MSVGPDAPDTFDTTGSKLPGIGTTIFTVISQLAAEHGAVNLGQGFPDFDPPAALIEALAAAARDGHNQYAPMAGLPELRTALAAKIRGDYGRAVDPEHEITVTAGASEALFDAILATVQTDDEVILLDPCYDSYEPAVRLAGGRAVHVALDAGDFTVDWERVEAALGPRTRLLVVNSPHNPTGATLAANDLEALAELLRGTRVLVLADEVYEHMVFDGEVHQSMLRREELAARSFVVSSLGKTYHCTGWKVGYCVAPPALTRELRKVHQFNAFCISTPAQRAFAHMLVHHPQHHQQLPAFYQAKRDRFRALLAATPLALLPVRGGYFQVVDYTHLATESDVELAGMLIREYGVAAIPLSPFYPAGAHAVPAGAGGVPRRLRLCFAKDEPTLEEAAARLARAFAR